MWGAHLAQPLGATHGVELVAPLGEPRRGVEVVIGAERHDQDVGLVNTAVGGHAPPFGIDRGDRLLQEAHAGLCDVAVCEADRVWPCPVEHHVELRVPEDERLVLVDQGHVDVVAERLRQHGRELKTPEARSEDDDPSFHQAIVVNLAHATPSRPGNQRSHS
jgi:hypothetical protein